MEDAYAVCSRILASAYVIELRGSNTLVSVGKCLFACFDHHRRRSALKGFFYDRWRSDGSKEAFSRGLTKNGEDSQSIWHLGRVQIWGDKGVIVVP
jgi:hypothetical protein